MVLRTGTISQLEDGTYTVWVWEEDPVDGSPRRVYSGTERTLIEAVKVLGVKMAVTN